MSSEEQRSDKHSSQRGITISHEFLSFSLLLFKGRRWKRAIIWRWLSCDYNEVACREIKKCNL